MSINSLSFFFFYKKKRKKNQSPKIQFNIPNSFVLLKLEFIFCRKKKINFYFRVKSFVEGVKLEKWKKEKKKVISIWKLYIYIKSFSQDHHKISVNNDLFLLLHKLFSFTFWKRSNILLLLPRKSFLFKCLSK